MHMMFVDESGDPGYPKDGQWKTWRGSKLFVRVGAIIHGWKWKAWNDRMVSFKINRGLTWQSEIHTTDIRRGKKAFQGRSLQERNFFLHQFLEFIGQSSDLTLIGVVIDKQKVNLSGSDRVIKPEVRSMELLLERYNFFLKNQNDRSGIVILDPCQPLNDDNIRYFQSYLQQHSKHLQPLHIVESTFFAKSHTSNMVQVADCCANVLYKKEASATGSSPEYSIIQGRFWRHNNRLAGHGIKRWP